MGGLMLLGLVGLWLFAIWRLFGWVADKLPPRWWRYPLLTLAALGLAVLPFIGEVLASREFDAACAANQDVYVSPNARGRTAVFVPPDAPRTTGRFATIYARDQRFSDVETKEVLFSYQQLSAEGPGFFWFFHVDSSHMPFFSRVGDCRPTALVNGKQLITSAGLTIASQPISAPKAGDTK